MFNRPDQGTAYAGQTNVIDQYPGSGVNIPQVDAIRRARAGNGAPLYQTPGQVMGGPREQQTRQGMTQVPKMAGQMESQMGQMANKPIYKAPPRPGVPTARGLPGKPKPAPNVRPREEFL